MTSVLHVSADKLCLQLILTESIQDSGDDHHMRLSGIVQSVKQIPFQLRLGNIHLSSKTNQNPNIYKNKTPKSKRIPPKSKHAVHFSLVSQDKALIHLLKTSPAIGYLGQMFSSNSYLLFTSSQLISVCTQRLIF